MSSICYLVNSDNAQRTGYKHQRWYKTHHWKQALIGRCNQASFSIWKMYLFLPESLIPNYLPSLTFIMIGFLIGYINIRCLNMYPFSVQKSQYHDTNTTFNVIYYFNFYDGSWSSCIFNINISRFFEFFRYYCFCIIGIILTHAFSLRWLIVHHYASTNRNTQELEKEVWSS